ncbi:MAG: hypothetical protein ACE5FU_13140 [Nitrospinota bacterium]
MKYVNRCLVIVKPKQPYIDWVNSVEEGDPLLDLEKARADLNTYLIKEFDETEMAGKYVEKVYADIFENELLDWYTAPELWPQKRDLRMFRKWFDIEIHLSVLELGKGDIIAE